MKKLFSIMLVALLAVIMLPLSAKAFSFAVPKEGDSNITVEKDRVINDTYFVAGNVLDLNGTVTGDLFAFGQTVDLTGKVNGNMFTGGSTITIDGPIGGDLYLGSGNAEISKNAVIGGDVIAGAGTLKIDGQIKGKVWAGVGALTIGSTAIITGNIVYSSDNKAKVDSAAKIGKISQKVAEKAKNARHWGNLALSKFISLLSMLLVGLILILLLPKWIKNVSEEIRSHLWKSLGWGFLTLVAVPVAIVICLVVFIGAPLAMILGVIYAIALYLAKIFAGLALGQYLNKDKWLPMWSLTVGLIIIFILSVLPFVGGLISFLAILIGLGAIASVKYRCFKEGCCKK